MKVILAAVGKIKESYVREAIDDYLNRIRKVIPLTEIEIRDERAQSVSLAMKKAMGQKSYSVAMAISGTMKSSEELATWFGKRLEEPNDLVFLIGGADGLPNDILSACREKLSLSKMTFPHRLARLVLAEQLYRALTILRNEPYHH